MAPLTFNVRYFVIQQTASPDIAYAKYMIAWLHRITIPGVTEIQEKFLELEQHWNGTKNADLEKIRVKIWTWVDSNQNSSDRIDKVILVARMVLCLAYPDNRELEDMGFFDDLLSNYGISRNEINLYDADHLPSRT